MGRIGGFRLVADEHDFIATASELADLAADASRRISDEITSPASAAAFIQSSAVARYPDLNAGVAHGLAHEWDDAQRLLRDFKVRAESFDQPSSLASWADRLIELLRQSEFEEAVRSCVESRRSALKLKPCDISF